MSRFVTLQFFSTMAAAILISASTPCEGHAQDGGNESHLRTILDQDLEIRNHDVIIQGGRIIPVQYVVPCLSDVETVAAIAESFRQAAGVELSEFAAAVSGRNDEDPDVWRRLSQA